MQNYELSRENLIKLLDSVASKTTLIAPMKNGLVRFQQVKRGQAKDIHLEKNAYFPIKEYFFRKSEVIFTHQDGKIELPKLDEPHRVFFGIRRCDLNGIMHQDKVFTEQVKDPYYAAQRKNSLLLGYHCNEAPSPFCFCGTLDLKEFFDVMFFDRKDKFVAEVGTEKGAAFVKKYLKFFTTSPIVITAQDRKIKNADRLKTTDISKLYDHPDWKKGVSQCLSCGACTNLCPTCYCFEFKDDLTVKGPSTRKREWSSCQVQDFTRVAGEHVFREKREERFKHRIYHQLEYFKEKNGVNLCVGCGRCIEGCPTRIDFVDIINKMK